MSVSYNVTYVSKDRLVLLGAHRQQLLEGRLEVVDMPVHEDAAGVWAPHPAARTGGPSAPARPGGRRCGTRRRRAAPRSGARSTARPPTLRRTTPSPPRGRLPSR